jgi:hypothetical protein
MGNSVQISQAIEGRSIMKRILWFILSAATLLAPIVAAAQTPTPMPFHKCVNAIGGYAAVPVPTGMRLVVRHVSGASDTHTARPPGWGVWVVNPFSLDPDAMHFIPVVNRDVSQNGSQTVFSFEGSLAISLIIDAPETLAAVASVGPTRTLICISGELTPLPTALTPPPAG